MIREVIKPQFTSLTIEIPSSYIDRDLELIIFPLDEQDEMKKKSERIHKESLRGVFESYAKEDKRALEDSAWQENIISRYKLND